METHALQTYALLVGSTLAAGTVSSQTDKYFTNTSRIVGANGDSRVTFAVFMRRRVVAALEPAIRLIRHFVPDVEIKRFYAEGDIVPSESKMPEITGSMQKLSEVETLMLQKIGFPCVSANNAYEMCRAMPAAAFMDMHARHGSGAEMNILAAYGAAAEIDLLVTQAAEHDRQVRAPLGAASRPTAAMQIPMFVASTRRDDRERTAGYDSPKANAHFSFEIVSVPPGHKPGVVERGRCAADCVVRGVGERRMPRAHLREHG